MKNKCIFVQVNLIPRITRQFTQTMYNTALAGTTMDEGFKGHFFWPLVQSTSVWDSNLLQESGHSG